MLSAEAQETLWLRVARAVVDDGMTQGQAVRTLKVSRKVFLTVDGHPVH